MARKGKEISFELKQIAVELHQNGHRISEIARLLSIPQSTCSDIIHRFGERGSLENRRRSGRPRNVSDRDYRVLERLVKKNRRSVLRDISAEFNEDRQVPVSTRTVQRHIHKHGYQPG